VPDSLCLSSSTVPGLREQAVSKQLLELPESHDHKVHRQDPDEDHLPESEVAGAVVIAGHLRVTTEEPLADAKYVEAAKENNGEKQSKNDSKSEHGIAVGVNDSDDSVFDHAILDRRMSGARSGKIKLWAAGAPR